MPFQPTKDEVNQAWGDLEAGKPISKEMQVYLEQLERREQENAAAAEATALWARREERTNDILDWWDRHYQSTKGEAIPEEVREDLRRTFRKGL